ncbi:hypothetical protein B0H10DRAFT_1808397 [Mycena sp. CBHHK59/15]|nr:hypothetical protein B0H10DRAFT_1808397 [Mycena sp. CBHHK59/15]
MTFQMIRDDQVLQGAEVLGPFESDEEWELAKWLIKNVGHNQMEEFLKLPIAINDLPGGVSWKLENIVLKGDLRDDNGKEIVENLELWYRDPVDGIWCDGDCGSTGCRVVFASTVVFVL